MCQCACPKSSGVRVASVSIFGRYSLAEATERRAASAARYGDKRSRSMLSVNVERSGAHSPRPPRPREAQARGRVTQWSCNIVVGRVLALGRRDPLLPELPSGHVTSIIVPRRRRRPGGARRSGLGLGGRCTVAPRAAGRASATPTDWRVAAGLARDRDRRHAPTARGESARRERV